MLASHLDATDAVVGDHGGEAVNFQRLFDDHPHLGGVIDDEDLGVFERRIGGSRVCALGCRIGVRCEGGGHREREDKSWTSAQAKSASFRVKASRRFDN